MKYFLVLFVFGILCRNVLATGLVNPVLHDFERRLVRLESRQFSESENLEHRMLQLETQLGTQKGEETLESSPEKPNNYEITKKETPSEVTTFLQRLENVEKNWEKELEDQVTKFSSKHESLSERFSAVEKHLEEEHTNFNQIMERLSKFTEKPKSAEGKREDSESDDSDSDDYDSDDSDSDDSEGSGSEPESDKSIEKMSTKSLKIGSKYYFIENNERESWFMAQRACRSINASLVSLKDEEEWRALKEALLPDHYYWVRIDDFNSSFLKWDDGEPYMSSWGENCVQLRSDHDFKMIEESCFYHKHYICESENPI